MMMMTVVVLGWKTLVHSQWPYQANAHSWRIPGISNKSKSDFKAIAMAMVNSTTQRFIFVNALNWLSTWNCDSGLTIAHSTAPCSSCAPNTHRNRDSHNPQPPEAHNPLFYSNIWRRAHVRSSTDLFSFTIVVLFLLLLLFALSVCLCRILAFTMCFVSSTVYGITCTDLCVSTTASTVVYCHSAIYTIESFRSADECSIRQQSRSRFYCWCAWIGSLLLRCVFFFFFNFACSFVCLPWVLF